jgi:hypothetical protein
MAGRKSVRGTLLSKGRMTQMKYPRALFVGAVFAIFALAGCSMPNYTSEFVKPGIADAQRQADTEACWKYVLSEEGQKQAGLLRGARIIGGGAVAIATEPNDGVDPKKNINNLGIFRDCMLGKGYTQQFRQE